MVNPSSDVTRPVPPSADSKREIAVGLVSGADPLDVTILGWVAHGLTHRGGELGTISRVKIARRIIPG